MPDKITRFKIVWNKNSKNSELSLTSRWGTQVQLGTLLALHLQGFVTEFSMVTVVKDWLRLVIGLDSPCLVNHQP